MNPWALPIFLLTYVGVGLGRFPRLAIDRTGIALLGAIGMVAIGGLRPEEALAAVSLPTLLLLYALMILSAQLGLGGFYTWLALRLTQWIRNPGSFLLLLMGAGGLLASVLANDIICLAFTPVLCVALPRRGLNPLPYLLGLAMSTNLGSAATLIGNPQSLLIAQTHHLGFLAFSRFCAPPSLISLLLAWCVLRLQFRGRWHLPAGSPSPQEPAWPALHRWQTTKGLLAILVTMALLVSPAPRTLSVLCVAGLLLPSRRTHSRPLLGRVDWHLLTLFCGLFIVVAGIQRTGLPATCLENAAGLGLDLHNPLPLAITALLLSNLVSNVPATLLLLPVLGPVPSHLSYVLSLATTYAGNLFLVGSLANLIVVEQAATFGIRISFRNYARSGIPVTVLSIAVLALWVWACS